jgi:hypothetical protein
MPSGFSPHSHILPASQSVDMLPSFYNSSKCLPASVSQNMLQQEEIHTGSIRGDRGMYLGHVAFIV